MQVVDIMSAPAVTVDPDTTLHEATGTILRHRIGSVIVTDHGPVGILTRSDILRVTYQTETPLMDRKVRNGMSTDLVTTSQTTSIESALQTMHDHEIKKLPVLDDLDLVGIVTLTDIAQHQPDRVSEVRATLERKDEWTD